jgi:threonine aldolase
LIALEEHPALLANDHRNAAFLASGLSSIPGISIDAGKVQTNIAIFRVDGTGLTGAGFSARLKARGVLMNAIDERQVRLVTHYDVSRDDCERALEIVRETAADAARGLRFS